MQPTRDELKAMIAIVEQQPDPFRRLMRDSLSWLVTLQRDVDEVKDALTKRRP